MYVKILPILFLLFIKIHCEFNVKPEILTNMMKTLQKEKSDDVSNNKFIRNMILQLPQILQNFSLENRVQKMCNISVAIDLLYSVKENTRQLIHDEVQAKQIILQLIEIGLLSDSNLLTNLLDFHYTFVQFGNDQLIDVIHRNTHILVPTCSAKMSHQQFYFKLYKFVFNHELKIFDLLTYFISKSMYQKDPTNEVYVAKNNIVNLMVETTKFYENLVQRAPSDLYNCDLIKGHDLGETYTHLHGLYQLVLYKSYELSDDYSNTCSVRSNQVPCQNDNTCLYNQKVCTNVVDCYLIVPLDVCLQKKDNSYRRYDRVQVKVSQRALNALTSLCEDRAIYAGPSKVTFSNGSSIISNACSCVCDTASDKSYVDVDRYIDLNGAESDVHNNFVITGLRFVKKQGVLFLEPQQGKLISNGRIDKESVGWKKTVIESQGNNITMINGQYPDLLTLSWNEKYQFGLNSMFENQKEDHVVTKVNFERFITKDGITRIILAVRLTRFNSSCGTLSTHWFRKYDTEDVSFSSLDLSDVEAPTEMLIEHNLLLKNKRFRFSPTGLTKIDTGATVVPYIDLRDVYSDEVTALANVVIGYLGAQGSGGYLIPRIFTYDNSNYYFKGFQG